MMLNEQDMIALAISVKLTAKAFNVLVGASDEA